MTASSLARGLARGAVAVFVLLGLLWVKALGEARYELSHADAMHAPSQAQPRVEALGRAVRWTAPLNPYAREALDALLELGRQQVRSGDAQGARLSFSTARGSLVSSAGIVQLEAERLREIDAQLEELGLPRGEGPSAAGHRAPTQAPWARLSGLLAFALWVAAAFALAHRPAQRQSWLYAGGLVVGLAGFVAGLWWS